MEKVKNQTINATPSFWALLKKFLKIHRNESPISTYIRNIVKTDMDKEGFKY